MWPRSDHCSPLILLVVVLYCVALCNDCVITDLIVVLQVGDGDAAPAGGGRALRSPLPLRRSGQSSHVHTRTEMHSTVHETIKQM